MLTVAAIRPTSPSLFLEAFVNLFRSKSSDQTLTHGTARYVKAGDRAWHEQTEISLQPAAKETPEAFMWRVWTEADDGDVMEYRLRDGKLVGATIVRKAGQALRPERDETFEAFAARVKAYTKELPRA